MKTDILIKGGSFEGPLSLTVLLLAIVPLLPHQNEAKLKI